MTAGPDNSAAAVTCPAGVTRPISARRNVTFGAACRGIIRRNGILGTGLTTTRPGAESARSHASPPTRQLRSGKTSHPANPVWPGSPPQTALPTSPAQITLCSARS
jgi:hypothetical protein